MAVTDMVSVDGEGRERRRSRLDEARSRLALALGQLPCGSRLGLGVFTAHRSILLMEPVEICENYAELLATLARIDHRMGWQGNSEIAKGLDSGLLVMRDLGSQPTLIFLTDGQEAPPISPRYRPPMHVEKGKAQALVVGVGGDELQPIPKLDALGRLAGTWAAGEVIQQDLRSLGRDANSSSQSSYVDDKPADSTPVAPVPGATPGREHLSAVREGYLRMLCQELGLDYHRLGSPEALARAMTNPAYRRDLGVAPRPLRGALAALALLLLLLVFRRELVLLASARPWRHGWDRLEGGAGRLQARAALAWRRAATRPQR
jgi:mxaL protein